LAAIWNIYNLGVAPSLSSDTIRKIVRDIIYCSVELPLYLLPNTEDALSNYLVTLRSAAKLFEKQLMIQFETNFGTEISEPDFLNSAELFSEMEELLTPERLRSKLEEELFSLT
jgi:hypothetical protein